MRIVLCMAAFAAAASSLLPAVAADWPRFRGPNGSAVSADTDLPVTWSDAENVAWKAALPGPGASSPVVSNGRVFVTCYSGYGVDRSNPGDPKDLQRHLVCLDPRDGRVLWDRTVPAVQPEDRYEGMLTEHGYASATPAADGERVYVFFGKSGVLAFDFDGNRLWQTSVGTGSAMMGWGSGTSLLLYKDLVIVNANAESESIVALDKATG
ncbi:MAG TPA: PQQ-binding-like beta-propeller repeat protein, partial [Planctomycetaceae bacterium]